MIRLDLRSRRKNPIPTPTVLWNPTPPKNLRLKDRLRNQLEILHFSD